MRRFLLISLCIAGCHARYNDDVSEPPDAACVYNSAGGVAEIVVHDPYTGQCVGDYAPPPCGDGCPCTADGAAEPYSGECYGPCSALDENECWADASCHPTYLSYDDYMTGDGVDPTPVFWGCWDITPNTPETTDLPCADLDDWTCSVTRSCASIYGTDEYENQMFELCVPRSAIGSGSDTSGVGDCFGTVTCDVAPPACPAGTYAGVLDGCYTGYCIPAAACGPLPCSQLTDGSACAARSDCDAVYTGSDCTCDDSGCTCASEVFEQCTDAGGSGSAL